MSQQTTVIALDIISELGKVEGLTTNQMIEVINGIRFAFMGHQPEEQHAGMIRASVMLENHAEVLKILGK